MSSKRGGALPDNYGDMNADIQILFADMHLARYHLVDRIRDAVPVQIDGKEGDTHLSKMDWARLFRWAKPSDRSAKSIAEDHDKRHLRIAVMDALDVDVNRDRERGAATKVELTRLWLTVSGVGNGQDTRDAMTGVPSS